ncbi:MAG: cytochrome c, partial [Ignavibacteria bacterium]
DANNCNGTNSTSVTNLPAGSLFSQVRSVLQANCVSCHSNGIANGGMNFEVDCNIVNNKDRIKARAVDANPSAMPPTGLISAADRQKIVNWVNAGGRFTD